MEKITNNEHAYLDIMRVYSTNSTIHIQTDNNFGGTRTQKKVHQVNALLLGTFLYFFIIMIFLWDYMFFLLLLY